MFWLEELEHPFILVYVYMIVLLPILASDGLNMLLTIPVPEYIPPIGVPPASKKLFSLLHTCEVLGIVKSTIGIALTVIISIALLEHPFVSVIVYEIVLFPILANDGLNILLFAPTTPFPE